LTPAERGNRSFVLARFVSNIVLVTLGAVLAPISLTLAPGVVGWVTLGVGSAAVLVTAAVFPVRGRGATQRYLDAASALLGALTVLAACAFAGDTLRWLSFAAAALLCALGLAGLIAHEAIMERAVRHDARVALRNGRAGPGAPLPDRSGIGTW
jgi:hypothetical protein